MADTSSTAGQKDTEGVVGGSRATEPGSPAGTNVDTEGASGGSAGAGTSTALTKTFETTRAGAGGTPESNPTYRAPSLPPSGSTKDTTRTDVQPGGSTTNPVPTSNTVVQQETANIGAAGSGTGANQPAAPTGVSAVTGPRLVTVSWTASADVANDPVRGYLVMSSAGGTTYAPRGTSVQVRNLDPGRTYTFQVAARNKAGLSAYSTATAAVRPYNPDQADVLKPGGLDAANVVNAVYLPDGSIKAGTGGTNNAPVLGAITPGAAASKTVTVNWTAPTVGTAPTSYNIKASDGTSTTSGAGTTSKAVVFAAAGASVTFTVQAVNATGPGVVSAPSGAVTVP